VKSRIGNHGFSLVELAVVVLIVSLMLTGALMAFRAQTDVNNVTSTQRTLETARDALLGFAAANGRLPCPATLASNGQELPAGGGACADATGFYPAATLGVQPSDPQGYLLDAWGNRILYSVTTVNTNAFTTANGISGAGFAALAPNLGVCSTSAGTEPPAGPACPSPGGASSQLTNSAVAVLISTGQNGSLPASAEELENTDSGRVYVSHTPTNTFDDIVVWISPFTLYNRLIASGAM